MSINDVDTSKKTVESVEVKTPDQLSPPVQTELEATAMADILGFDLNEASRYQDKVETLLDWAKTQSDDHSPENLKWVIRELSFKIGSPPLGQKLVNWLAEYAYLHKESQEINKRLDKMKHGN